MHTEAQDFQHLADGLTPTERLLFLSVLTSLLVISFVLVPQMRADHLQDETVSALQVSSDLLQNGAPASSVQKALNDSKELSSSRMQWRVEEVPSDAWRIELSFADGASDLCRRTGRRLTKEPLAGAATLNGRALPDVNKQTLDLACEGGAARFDVFGRVALSVARTQPFAVQAKRETKANVDMFQNKEQVRSARWEGEKGF